MFWYAGGGVGGKPKKFGNHWFRAVIFNFSVQQKKNNVKMEKKDSLKKSREKRMTVGEL